MKHINSNKGNQYNANFTFFFLSHFLYHFGFCCYCCTRLCFLSFSLTSTLCVVHEIHSKFAVRCVVEIVKFTFVIAQEFEKENIQKNRFTFFKFSVDQFDLGEFWLVGIISSAVGLFKTIDVSLFDLNRQLKLQAASKYAQNE